MTEGPQEHAGQHISEGAQGGANVGKGLHLGQRGQQLGSEVVQMPAEGPPGPASVSPPPPPATTMSGDTASGDGGSE